MQAKQSALLVLLAAALTCLAASLIMMPYIPDDSYISFRYAENLTRGQGLTFNPGEPPVEAYSNFLWIVFCAMLHKVGMDLPSFSPYVGSMLAVLTVVLLWWLFVRRGLSALQMLFPLLILATSGPFIMYAISGLEMPLFALLLVLAMVWVDMVFTSGRLVFYVLLAVTGMLLGLCRPEGMAAYPVIVAVVVAATWRKRDDSQFTRTRYRNLAIATAVFVVLIAAYNYWRINYFGEVLPTPFLSKGGGGKSVFNAWQQNLEIYFKVQGYYFPPLGFYFVALALIGVLGVTSSLSRLAAKRTEIVALTLALFYVATYFNFKDWMPGMRYHASLVPLFLIPAIQILTPYFTKGSERSRQARATFWLGGFAAVLMSLSVYTELRIITQRTEESNQECLIKLAEWLRAISPPGAVLAMSDVGAVPYLTGFKTIDIHPESLTDLHIAKNGWSKEYFYRRRPHIVILPSRSLFLTKFYPEHFATVEDGRFQRLYRFYGASRYDWYNDRCYWIFLANGFPTVSDELMEKFPHGIGTISRKASTGRGEPIRRKQDL